MAKRSYKSSEIWVALGVILVFSGVWALAERVFSPWWPDFSALISAAANVIWPVVIIVAGILVIYAACTGRFAAINGMRLYRSRNNRKIAGVCGGLAEYFSLDPVLMRVIWIVLLFATAGTMIAIYLLCWVIIPEGPRTA